MKRFTLFLVMGLLISGCRISVPVTSEPIVIPTIMDTDTPIPVPPTQTPVPTLTATATIPPAPDLGVIGLPTEPAGSVALDFVDQMCMAEWYTEGQSLPCPGDSSQADTGYVMRLDGGFEGVPPGFQMMLTYPPQVHYSRISGKYPPFTIEKGDRLRTVTACLADKVCDVEFSLYYINHGGLRIISRWHYLFIDEPVVFDYSLDSIAGETVQFVLSATAIGGLTDTYAVWIAPHIYRPAP
jgi:hypothetical protein